MRCAALIAAVTFATPALVACDAEDGPAEKVGEKVDEGAKDAKRAVKDAAD